MGKDIPGPLPDDDPVLELSVWRMVLEKNPTLLQAYVLELRRITDRPFLMPHQALAELDTAVGGYLDKEVTQLGARGGAPFTAAPTT